MNSITKKTKLSELTKGYGQQVETPYPEQYDDDVLAAVASAGPVLQNVDIMDIWPDLAQPRRAIPLAVRGQWHGNPLHVIEVLDTWQRMAESAAGITLNMVDILQGRGEGFDTPENPVAESFIDLLRLAASIFADGLTNAITIAPGKDRYLIETGERRWLAHHLLYQHIDDKFGRILAREVQRDVWRQATENNQRRKLNAIEMARQLALLVMDMYEVDRNTSFDSLEMMMRDGCDRYFYAQVALGNIWKVKQGFAERVQAAMGLPSYSQVSRYRNLLRLTDDDKLNDEIWIRADMENWSEFRIREYVETLLPHNNTLPSGKVILPSHNNTLPSGKVTGESLPMGKHDTPSAVDYAIGQRVLIDDNINIKGTVSGKSMGRYQVNLLSGGSRWFERERLTPVVEFPNRSVQPRGAATPTIEEESGLLTEDNDYATPLDGDEGDSVIKTPKPVDMQLVIQKIADAAGLMNLPEQSILEDLARLNQERLEAVIRDGGSDLLEQLTDGYYKALSDTLDKIGKYIHAYIDEIVAEGRRIIERN